jgi:hypothetical protein
VGKNPPSFIVFILFLGGKNSTEVKTPIKDHKKKRNPETPLKIQSTLNQVLAFGT